MGGEGERRTWTESGTASIAAFVVSMLVVLRAPIQSGFDRGFGDRADAIIAIAINEHWRNVLAGVEAWNRPLYFTPYADTLGYNDGYFLSGLNYSGWRLVADPLFADTLTAASWKALGFIATWWLVRRTFGWPRSIASVAALLFTIANGMFVQADHEQLNTIALLPVAMILAVGATKAEMAGAKGRARLLAAGLAALLAAWLFTAYYLAWFTLWFGLLLALMWALLARPNPADWIRAHGPTLAVFGIIFAIASVPFLLAYLPKAWETGGHGYSKLRPFLVTPVDLINVGPHNIAWGWLMRSFARAASYVTPDQNWFTGEHETGFPLLFLAIALASARTGLARQQPTVIRAFALAVLVSWGLTLWLGPFSPWSAVYWLVPGARGLRVIVRYQLFLILPLELLVLAANRQRIVGWLRTAPLLISAIALLLVLEQLNSADKAELPRHATLAAFAALPSPPPACRSFYAITARKGEPLYRSPQRQALYPHNVDAMLLAELWRVPTINGFSTFNPPDWDFANPTASDYDLRVIRFVHAHGLTGVCRLDARQARPWSLVAG